MLSSDTSDALAKLGQLVRRTENIKKSHMPLPLFFVDLYINIETILKFIIFIMCSKQQFQ